MCSLLLIEKKMTEQTSKLMGGAHCPGQWVPYLRTRACLKPALLFLSAVLGCRLEFTVAIGDPTLQLRIWQQGR